MFFKLLKHEFRATSPYILLTWLGLVVFSGLSVLFGILSEALDIFYIPLILSTLLFSILAIASLILVYVIVIRRFCTNIYGREGYLTLTLPVKRSSIVLSKLITSMVWIIGTVVALLLSSAIQVLADSSDSLISFVADVSLITDWVSEFVDIRTWLLVTIAVLSFIVLLAKQILMFYSAVSIGQLFKKHIVIGSFFGYIIVNVVSKSVDSVCSGVMNASELMTRFMNELLVTGNLHFSMTFDMTVLAVIYILLNAIFAAILLLFTDFIMRKHVNLK